jgi:hypothetical protein
MSAQATSKTQIAAPARQEPARSGQLQRRCACGQHTAAGGECHACGQQRLQRLATSRAEAAQVPDLVHQVLSTPGQPLDAATRGYFEPRLGHDFSRVRVHTDTKAAESARSVNALAYTFGGDVVFGAGQFAPETTQGKRMLAHELTHVVQQSGSTPQAPLALGDSDSRAERQADEVAERLDQSPGPIPISPAIGSLVSRNEEPAIRRWKIGGNTATSDVQGDTLGGLAQKAGAHFNDWKCIKPLSQRTSTLAKPPANFNERYELYVQPGDTFDISNLTATTGPSVSVYLFDDKSEAANANIAKLFYPGSTSTSDADLEIETTAVSGAKPISSMLIMSHAGGHDMWGAAGTFTPMNFDPEEPKQLFNVAAFGSFPRRCWFTRNATARSVGCDSETWGQDFAEHYLRVGASVTTTTKSVRPTCSAPLNVTGACSSFDGLDFAASFLSTAARLSGPYTTAAAFHAGPYWKNIKGTL